MNKKQLSEKASRRFNTLMRAQYKRIQKAPQLWRKQGVPQATNALIEHDQILVIRLLQLYNGNLTLVRRTLRQLSKQAQQQANQALATLDTHPNQPPAPLGIRPPTPEEIALNIQNGVPDLMFTQFIDAQAAEIEAENETVEINQQEANRLLEQSFLTQTAEAEDPAFRPNYSKPIEEEEEYDHPIRYALTIEAAIKLLMQLAKPASEEEEKLAVEQVLEKVKLAVEETKRIAPTLEGPKKI